jgi:hypothetical protein
LGVIVLTIKQTPRRCGHSLSAGDLDRFASGLRPFRINWFIVGMYHSLNFETIAYILPKNSHLGNMKI